MNSKILFSQTCTPDGTYIHAYTQRYSHEMKQAQTQKEIEQRSHSQWKTNKRASQVRKIKVYLISRR